MLVESKGTAGEVFWGKMRALLMLANRGMEGKGGGRNAKSDGVGEASLITVAFLKMTL